MGKGKEEDRKGEGGEGGKGIEGRLASHTIFRP